MAFVRNLSHTDTLSHCTVLFGYPTVIKWAREDIDGFALLTSGRRLYGIKPTYFPHGPNTRTHITFGAIHLTGFCPKVTSNEAALSLTPLSFSMRLTIFLYQSTSCVMVSVVNVCRNYQAI